MYTVLLPAPLAILTNVCLAAHFVSDTKIVCDLASTKGPGRDYALQGNRGFAYAVLYAAMNVASLLSGWTLDLFRITLRDGFAIKGQPADSVLNSGYRLYLVLGMPPELPYDDTDGPFT